MAVTKLSNLINPQVIADFIDEKLTDNMVFSPLCTIDTTLVGIPGDTINLPSYSYIGDADVLAEGSQLSLVSLNASMVSCTVHKIAQGVEITDEAVLSAKGDPIGESTYQLTLALANKLDNEVLAVLNSISGTMCWETSTSTTEVKAADINDALEKFGEDVNGTKVAVVSPAIYTQFRKASDWLPASEIAADRLVRGAVGEAYGCQVIVSNKLTTPKTAYIVKPGALRIFMKRDTLVEADRDITKFETILTASKHEVCYLYRTSGAIKLKKKNS